MNSSDNNAIQDDLIESVVNGKFGSIVQDYAEMALDTMIDNEAIEAIPIIGHVIKSGKGFFDLREKILINKMILFLSTASAATANEKEVWIKKYKLDTEKGQRRVGLAMVVILEKLSTLEKSLLLGKVFRSYLREEISSAQAIRSAEMIDHAFIGDLEKLINGDWHGNYNLVSIGILTPDKVRLPNTILVQMGIPQNGSVTPPKLTEDGELLLKILKN